MDNIKIIKAQRGEMPWSYRLKYDDKFIGTCHTAIDSDKTAKTAEITRLYIHSQYRGQGYGTKLLQYVRSAELMSILHFFLYGFKCYIHVSTPCYLHRITNIYDLLVSLIPNNYLREHLSRITV